MQQPSERGVAGPGSTQYVRGEEEVLSSLLCGVNVLKSIAGVIQMRDLVCPSTAFVCPSNAFVCLSNAFMCPSISCHLSPPQESMHGLLIQHKDINDWLIDSFV